MEALTYIVKILVPPKKGDISLKCKTATETSSINSGNSSTLKIFDQVEEHTTEEISISDSENDPSKKSNWFQRLFQGDTTKFEQAQEIKQDTYYTHSPIDRFIGYAVDVSGSIYVFTFVMILLIGWIVWGAVTGAGNTWQIVMQDGQSIQTYVWNTFLMRQQLDNNEKLLILYGRLKSRTLTHKKLLEKAVENIQEKQIEKDPVTIDESKYDENLIEFKDQNLFERISEFVSKILGSLSAVIIYWAGIFAWIGCGALYLNNGTAEQPLYQRFSNTWQMYINTATAIELLVTTVFLENVRARNNQFILQQTDIFNKLDADLEYLLRDLTKEDEANPLVTVPHCPRDRIQKAISYYAHIIGNGLGLIISVCVFATWIAIGNVMDWSANWWLVIGSYTGLMGFIDGFVLREVYFSNTGYEQAKFLDLLEESQAMLDIANIPVELEKPKLRKTITNRISLFINRICSSKYSVVAAFLVVIALVIFASALKWSELAQLIVNSPTMIVEGFFFLILIQAHNWAEDERSGILQELTKSRVMIRDYIRHNH